MIYPSRPGIRVAPAVVTVIQVRHAVTRTVTAGPRAARVSVTVPVPGPERDTASDSRSRSARGLGFKQQPFKFSTRAGGPPPSPGRAVAAVPSLRFGSRLRVVRVWTRSEGSPLRLCPCRKAGPPDVLPRGLPNRNEPPKRAATEPPLAIGRAPPAARNRAAPESWRARSAWRLGHESIGGLPNQKEPWLLQYSPIITRTSCPIYLSRGVRIALPHTVSSRHLHGFNFGWLARNPLLPLRPGPVQRQPSGNPSPGRPLESPAIPRARAFINPGAESLQITPALAHHTRERREGAREPPWLVPSGHACPPHSAYLPAESRRRLQPAIWQQSLYWYFTVAICEQLTPSFRVLHMRLAVWIVALIWCRCIWRRDFFCLTWQLNPHINLWVV
jgi:hypothetical protein